MDCRRARRESAEKSAWLVVTSWSCFATVSNVVACTTVALGPLRGGLALSQDSDIIESVQADKER